MFARQVFRPATVLKSHVRRYATEPSKTNSNAAIYAGVAAAAGVGACYYLSMGAGQPTGRNASRQGKESEAEGMPASRTEESNIPAKTDEPMLCFKGGDQGFVALKLESVEPINHNTKRFRFSLPEEESVSGLKVASALLTKYKTPEMEKPMIRPYTPISDEDSKGKLDFIIKRYPNGPMSEHVHNMKPGETLDMKGPIPKYPWSANKHEHIALIAGGTGITPMYQLARAIFKNPEDKTKVTLVYGNITEDDILLRKEWEELEKNYPQRFRAFYTLDQPPEGWKQGSGYITKDLLKQLLPDPVEGGDKIKIFVCGPPGMYKAITGPKKSPSDQGDLSGILADLHYTKEQVYKY